MKLNSNTVLKKDLNGAISVVLKDNISLDDICLKFSKEYNPDRLEAMAIKIFYGKELQVTVFSVDKERQEGNNFQPDKMPVKKIKLPISSLQEIAPFIKELSFTLTNGHFPLEDMQVINK